MISVGFLRPRMGIGGAERLVTDAAVCLKQRGRDVTLFVPDRMTVAQFPELAAHKIPFERAGQFMPSHIAGRMRAPLSIARTAYAGWRMSHSARRPDVIFSDVVPHAAPERASAWQHHHAAGHETMALVKGGKSAVRAGVQRIVRKELNVGHLVDRAAGRAATLLEDHEVVDPGTPQLDPGADAGEPGADDHHGQLSHGTKLARY